MTDTTNSTKHNKAFYAAIAGCLVGLFSMLVVPCMIAVFIARYREKRRERRDALAGEDADDDDCSTDYLVYGPFPFDSALYHVDEVGESSGYRAPQNSVAEFDSAVRLNIDQEDTAAMTLALAQQEQDIAITTPQQEQYTILDDLREPQYQGKGKALMYAQLQTVLVEQQEQQLPENAQAQLPGSIQEDLSEDLPATLPEATAELKAEQKVAEEFQDAPEVAPEATPTEDDEQLLAKKENQA